MRSRKELLALTFPGHDDREHAREVLRAALRAAAEGGLARNDRSTQRPFCRVIGWVLLSDMVDKFRSPLRTQAIPGSGWIQYR